MASFASIQKQIAALNKRAETIRKTELAFAANKIKALMARYGLTVEDLGSATTASKTPTDKAAKATRKAAGPKTPGLPKYQDPKSGKTWTGNGKAPGWIAGAKNRDLFLIQTASAAAAPNAATGAPAKPAARRAKAAAATAPAKKTRAKKAAVSADPAAPASAAPAKPASA